MSMFSRRKPESLEIGRVELVGPSDAPGRFRLVSFAVWAVGYALILRAGDQCRCGFLTGAECGIWRKWMRVEGC